MLAASVTPVQLFNMIGWRADLFRPRVLTIQTDSAVPGVGAERLFCSIRSPSVDVTAMLGSGERGDGVVHDGDLVVRAAWGDFPVAAVGIDGDADAAAIPDRVAADFHVAGAAGFQPPVFGRNLDRFHPGAGDGVIDDLAVAGFD